MLFDYREQIYVAVHSITDPSPAEWTHYCAQLERDRGQTRGCVVLTLGGAPSSKQRVELRDAYGDRGIPPTAVMTRSALARGIMTSLNWFSGNKLVAFDPNDFDRAMQYIATESGPFDRREISEAIWRLASKLEISLPLGMFERHSRQVR